MVGSEVDCGGRADRTSQWFGYGGVCKEGMRVTPSNWQTGCCPDMGS